MSSGVVTVFVVLKASRLGSLYEHDTSEEYSLSRNVYLKTVALMIASERSSSVGPIVEVTPWD